MWTASNKPSPRHSTPGAGPLLAAVAALSVSAAVGHPGHVLGELFRRGSFDAAQHRAAESHQLVCVFVQPPNPAPPPLVEPTVRVALAADLLQIETIPVLLAPRDLPPTAILDDIGESGALALFDKDANLLSHRVTSIGPDALAEWVIAALSDADTLARTRTAHAESPDDMLVRERLGRALARRGKLPDAHDTLTKLFEAALIDRGSMYAFARRGTLLSQLLELAKRHPPTQRFLDEQWRSLQRTVLHERDDAHVARMLAEFARLTDRLPVLLQVFDQLTDDARRVRHVLREALFFQLLEAQRYHEMLNTGAPTRLFDRAAQHAAMQIARNGGITRTADGVDVREYTLRVGAAWVEALYGADQPDAARRIRARVLRFEDSPDARALLDAAETRAATHKSTP